MHARLLIGVGVLLGWFALAASASATSTLEVKDLRVEFLADQKVRVRGSLRCRGLRRSDLDIHHPDSQIDINVDFPHGVRGFSLLPDRWSGKSKDPDSREQEEKVWKWTPGYIKGGAWHRVATSKRVIYNSTYIFRPPVIDKVLDNYKDDGRWIAFDKTLNFKMLKVDKGLEYRVVICWKLNYLRQDEWFGHIYTWAVYGPFTWGDAPPSPQTLTATYRRPVFVTKKGAKSKQPEGEEPKDEPQATQPDPDKAERPKPARTGKRPTQLAAVEAGARLEKTLTAWPEVERLGTMASPRMARLTIQLAPKQAAADPAAVVARIAVETAYEFTWVQSIEITVKGDHGASTVTLPWDAAAAFAVKESELAEFFLLWKVDGTAIPAPGKDATKPAASGN